MFNEAAKLLDQIATRPSFEKTTTNLKNWFKNLDVKFPETKDPSELASQINKVYAWR